MLPEWMLGAWIVVGGILAVISLIIGFIGVHEAKSHHTGRYPEKDARMILAFLVLGPLLAPLWPVAIPAGALIAYGTILKRVNKDAHLGELIPDLAERRAAYRNYQKLKEHNENLERALEASNNDKERF